MLAGQHPLKVLFIGNSHTYVNDLPAMVKGLLESDGKHRSVTTRLVAVEFLNNAALKVDFHPGEWDVVVLQGASLSSSHKFKYSNDGALSLAKAACKSGAKTLLFAEWPRDGWDESDWICSSYKEIFGSTKAKLVDVPHVFDQVHAKFPDVGLWQPDGNHEQTPGTFIAAACIHRWIVGAGGPAPSYVAPGVPKALAAFAEDAAKARFLKVAR